jgi:AGCS family alanine or glycine:cation symporter
MYYIERGLGRRWKPLAVFFAIMLGFTAFLTGNAVQANTVADTMATTFAIPHWATGLATSALVASVVLGGITRIGRVTSVLAPLMAAIYVLGALYIILTNIERVAPTFGLIFSEAFTPSAGVAGTGVGAFLVTMMWGVRRGLFSNEAGQGSAPIAHAAAKTDEPVSEGVVALLEPFIDTLIICTMTGLVLIVTDVWNDRVSTQLTFSGAGDYAYVVEDSTGRVGFVPPPPGTEIRIAAGVPTERGPGALRYAWHEAPVDSFFVDAGHQTVFTGRVVPGRGVAVADDGTEYRSLYGPAVESAGPLTMLAFSRGLPGTWGRFIVVISILLFAVSTAISWSYYGDRCANYLFGPRAVVPYKAVFVGMHFFGAVVTLNVIWTLGDVALGIVILPNLIALLLLSGKVKELTDSYFAREPWKENREAHRRYVEAKRDKP